MDDGTQTSMSAPLRDARDNGRSKSTPTLVAEWSSSSNADGGAKAGPGAGAAPKAHHAMNGGAAKVKSTVSVIAGGAVAPMPVAAAESIQCNMSMDEDAELLASATSLGGSLNILRALVEWAEQVRYQGQGTASTVPAIRTALGRVEAALERQREDVVVVEKTEDLLTAKDVNLIHSQGLVQRRTVRRTQAPLPVALWGQPDDVPLAPLQEKGTEPSAYARNTHGDDENV